jgi:hypothetical protein
MSTDGKTPGAPSGKPGDVPTTVGIVAALIHLEQATRGGPPAPLPPIHEPKQVPRRPGTVRDHKGRFLPRR